MTRARDAWHPELLRVYGLRPWEMERFTPREMRELNANIRRLAEQQQQ